MPCHHVVERLAKRHRVFYIDNFGGIRDLAWSDGRRVLRKLGGSGLSVIGCQGGDGGSGWRSEGSRSKARSGEERGIVVERPLIVPTPRIPVLQVLNGKLLNRRIKRLITENGIEKPIIWTRLPIELVWRAIDGVDRSFLIYQMIDKFPEHPKIAKSLRERHGRWERHFTETADLVFASARGLWEQKKAVNPQSYFFPNGVSGIFRGTKVPPEPPASRRPIVGFAGAIGTSLDIEWVIQVARSRPGYDFVLLGTIDPEVDVSALRDLPNVRLEGRVAHESLPEWFGEFDAAFMAYRDNEYQRYTFPSKMAEYLLAGLPVVSNCLPEVEAYGAIVSITDSPAEMAEALDRAIRERRDPEKVATRRAAGDSLSWERIVEGMEEVIEEAKARNESATAD